MASARGSRWAWFLVPMLAYFVVARASLVFILQPEHIAPLWPASGLALAAYLRAPDWTRRRCVLAAIAVGYALANISVRMMPSTLCLGLVNLGEVLIAGSLLRRWNPTRVPRFDRVSDLPKLVAAGVVAAGAAAFPGALFIASFTPGGTYRDIWNIWFVSDGLGILVVTPALIATWQSRPLSNPRIAAEFVVAILAVLGATYLVFGSLPEERPMLLNYPFVLLFPLMLWIGLRLTPGASALACVIMSAVAAIQTVRGTGPFARLPQTHEVQVVVLQIAMTAWTLCSLALAAMTEENRRATRAAKENASLAMEAAVALAQSQQQYQSVVDHLKEVIFQTDMQGHWTFLNPAWTEITGFTVEETLGRSFLDSVHPDDRMENLDKFSPLIAREKEYCRHQVRYLTRKGGFRWIEVYARLTIGQEGKILGTSGTLNDVTDRRMAEEQLRSAKEAAEAASVAKSRFLAQMSHEIRTPLTSILGYADLLERSGSPDASVTDSIQTIRRNGEHLLAVINDILDLSKIEAGRMTVEYVPTHLGPLLGEIASVMRQRAQAKRLTFEVRFLTPVPAQFPSDPTRLRQILFNLIGNAVKFTHTGKIQVLLRYDAAASAGPRLTIAVQDTGIGMTDDQVRKLFSPFTQADASHARLFGGTGLVLSISRSRANLLGGDVELLSTYGAGSTFTLALPLPLQEGADLISEIPSPIVSAAHTRELCRMRGRVLLVDDSADVRRLVQTYLRGSGITAETASNGHEAVAAALAAAAQGNPFHVILMDGQMPGMDGLAATRALRRAGYTAPIAALTANVLPEDRQQWMAAGANTFLTKPIDVGSFMHTVRAYLPSAPQPAPCATPALANPLLDDPFFEPLIREFAAGLGPKSDALTSAARRGDLAEVARLAHQLKGIGGSYGFAGISDRAASLEAAAKSSSDGDPLEHSLHELLEVCREAAALCTASPSLSEAR